MNLVFREALISDIPQIQEVRHSVKENTLSDPLLVTDDNCKKYITERGKGWVCEQDKKIVGFAIADLEGSNIWALFVRPENEKNQIGKRLHDTMLEWYFSSTTTTVWLSTSPCTRAEQFYKHRGWKEAGMYGSKEVKLEMSYKNWMKKLK
ncbi:hypothetical protein BH10BAC3_BH10BAC3_35790 [soil metagenome]